jgi:hypothetical protein
MRAYSEFFKRNVAGTVNASFLLDDKGNPLFTVGPSGNCHYKISLNVVTENPEVVNVIYKLHPTYYDPIRESSDRESNFQVIITSYGDYDLAVDVQAAGKLVTHTATLFDLLSESHKDSANPAIKEALEWIRGH